MNEFGLKKPLKSPAALSYKDNYKCTFYTNILVLKVLDDNNEQEANFFLF